MAYLLVLGQNFFIELSSTPFTTLQYLSLVLILFKVLIIRFFWIGKTVLVILSVILFAKFSIKHSHKISFRFDCYFLFFIVVFFNWWLLSLRSLLHPFARSLYSFSIQRRSWLRFCHWVKLILIFRVLIGIARFEVVWGCLEFLMIIEIRVECGWFFSADPF